MNKLILQYGIIAGVGTILYILLFYYIDPRMMLGAKVQYSSMLIVLACMIWASLQKRKSLEGWIGFREVIKIAFGVYVISSILYYLFYYILFNFIDPNLVEIQRQVLIEGFESMKAAGLGPKLTKKQLLEQDQILRTQDLTVTLGVCAYGLARSFIFGFILSAIIGFTLKRERNSLPISNK